MARKPRNTDKAFMAACIKHSRGWAAGEAEGMSKKKFLLEGGDKTQINWAAVAAELHMQPRSANSRLSNLRKRHRENGGESSESSEGVTSDAEPAEAQAEAASPAKNSAQLQREAPGLLQDSDLTSKRKRAITPDVEETSGLSDREGPAMKKVATSTKPLEAGMQNLEIATAEPDAMDLDPKDLTATDPGTNADNAPNPNAMDLDQNQDENDAKNDAKGKTVANVKDDKAATEAPSTSSGHRPIWWEDKNSWRYKEMMIKNPEAMKDYPAYLFKRQEEYLENLKVRQEEERKQREEEEEATGIKRPDPHDPWNHYYIWEAQTGPRPRIRRTSTVPSNSSWTTSEDEPENEPDDDSDDESDGESEGEPMDESNEPNETSETSETSEPNEPNNESEQKSEDEPMGESDNPNNECGNKSGS